MNIFDKYYAYCSIMQTCSLVPPSTPDTAFYSGSVYYPLGKPEDPTFYWLNRMRQEQSAAQRADFLINLYDANGKVASSTYRIYHDAVLNSEKQAGRMFTSLIGIEERVSPNEIDEDSVEVFDEKTSIFNPFTVEDFTAFQADQKAAMEERALSSGLLEEARAKAVSGVEQLLSAALPESCTLEIQ